MFSRAPERAGMSIWRQWLWYWSASAVSPPACLSICRDEKAKIADRRTGSWTALAGTWISKCRCGSVISAFHFCIRQCSSTFHNKDLHTHRAMLSIKLRISTASRSVNEKTCGCKLDQSSGELLAVNEGSWNLSKTFEDEKFASWSWEIPDDSAGCCPRPKPFAFGLWYVSINGLLLIPCGQLKASSGSQRDWESSTV